VQECRSAACAGVQECRSAGVLVQVCRRAGDHLPSPSPPLGPLASSTTSLEPRRERPCCSDTASSASLDLSNSQKPYLPCLINTFRTRPKSLKKSSISWSLQSSGRFPRNTRGIPGILCNTR